MIYRADEKRFLIKIKQADTIIPYHQTTIVAISAIKRTFHVPKNFV